MKGAFGELRVFIGSIEEIEDPNLGVRRPKRIEDFSDVHGLLLIYKLRADNRTKLTRIHTYRRIKRLVEGTAAFHGHSLTWPVGVWRERVGPGQNTFEDTEVRALVRAATAELRDSKQRIKKANALAGGVSSAVRAGVKCRTTADVLAYTRDVLGLRPCSQKSLIADGHRRFVHATKSLKTPSGGRGLFAYLTEFLPTRAELAIAVILILARTGWNQQTVLDLDANDWCEQYFLTSEDDEGAYWLIRSVKTRPQERYQETISRREPEFHVYQVIKWAIEATAPLRNLVQRQRDAVGRKIEEGVSDPATVVEYRKLDEMKNRVWLTVDPQDLSTPSYLSGGTDISDAAVHIIAKHNITDGESPLEWNAPKLRDAWIIWAYEHSSYNLLVAQWAARHKRLSTLVHYLDNRRAAARGHDRVWTFAENFFGEVSLQKLDPEVLKGLIENGRLSAEDAMKLTEASFLRTRWGAYCRDPFNPDFTVNPGHPSGEECRTQNCFGCRQAFWFFESASEIRGFITQLECIQQETPVDTWQGSEHHRRLEFLNKVFAAYSEQARAEAEARQMLPPLPLVEFAASRLIKVLPK
jgi:hypothetical protein